MIPNKDQVIVNSTEPTGTNRKKVWMKTKKNLFDEQYELGYGYDQTTGERITYANIYSNKNIMTIPLNMNKICLSKNGIAILVRFFFYDENKNFMTSVVGNEQSNIIAIPENARYCNFQTDKANLNSDYTNILVETADNNTIIPTNYDLYNKNTVYLKNDNDEYEEFGKKDLDVGYATNEYFNGYRVFKKVIHIDSFPNNTTKSIPHNIRIRDIISMNFTAKWR